MNFISSYFFKYRRKTKIYNILSRFGAIHKDKQVFEKIRVYNVNKFI